MVCRWITTTEATDAKQKQNTNSSEPITAWSCDTEGLAQKCVARCYELVGKANWHESWRKLRRALRTRAQIVGTCLCFARVGRPGVLWTVNMLARSVTKWNQTCTNDKLHQSNEERQTLVLLETKYRTANLDYFRTLLLPHQLQAEGYTYWDHKYLLQFLGCAKNKQTAVSYCRAEAEIVSLDVGLKMEGIPALSLRDSKMKIQN